MKRIFIFSLPFWIANLALVFFIGYQNKQAQELLVARATIDSSGEYSKNVFTAEDLNLARQSGKTDGKIDVLLQMDKINLAFSPEDIDKIIQTAEKLQNQENVENSFLGLLSRAAYHKGLATGIEESKIEVDQAYENGYHAAIDDFTCPETGQIKMPKKEELKPKK